ncbi:MAG TPA: hypothetical protein VE861_07200 [Gemmatimonadaceae bacterium]|nr:hypothetical protein [Gemmatimonadaceae bacterium]
MPSIVNAQRALLVAAGIACCTMTSTAAAQPTSGPQLNPAPNTQEFGLDAGAIFGLGDRSSFSVTIPAARARVGFFLNNDSRWSIEPAAGFAYSKIESVPYQFDYNLELGALYHFRAPAAFTYESRSSIAYLRPFVGLVGVATGGDDGGSDNELSLGAGYGVKIPLRQGLALRLEGNAGYGLDNNAFRLGAFAGISFFARNVIPTPR